jgi:hypothetical protein
LKNSFKGGLPWIIKIGFLGTGLKKEKDNAGKTIPIRLKKEF